MKQILPNNFFEHCLEDKISQLILTFIGKPYIINPIKDNLSSLLRFDGFDCVTFIETILAIALSSENSEIEEKLINIRYYNSKIDWSFRHHFTSIDWIPSNRKLVSNVFSNSSLLRRISRRFFFENNSSLVPNFLSDQVMCKFPYTSFEQIMNLSFDKKYYIALIIGKKDWIIVDHVGFIEFDGTNTNFIHASSIHGSVVKEDFYDYINKIHNNKLGISIFNIRS